MHYNNGEFKKLMMKVVKFQVTLLFTAVCWLLLMAGVLLFQRYRNSWLLIPLFIGFHLFMPKTLDYLLVDVIYIITFSSSIGWKSWFFHCSGKIRQSQASCGLMWKFSLHPFLNWFFQVPGYWILLSSTL
jgi:hypothetical protein